MAVNWVLIAGFSDTSGQIVSSCGVRSIGGHEKETRSIDLPQRFGFVWMFQGPENVRTPRDASPSRHPSLLPLLSDLADSKKSHGVVSARSLSKVVPCCHQRFDVLVEWRS